MSSKRNWNESVPSAEEIFNTVPLLVKEMVCTCSEPDWQGYWYFDPDFKLNHDKYPKWWDLSIRERVRRSPGYASWCTKCLKIAKYCVDAIYQYCEGCAKYYVPEPKPGTYPIIYFLCKDCDTPVPERPKRRNNETLSKVQKDFISDFFS